MGCFGRKVVIFPSYSLSPRFGLNFCLLGSQRMTRVAFTLPLLFLSGIAAAQPGPFPRASGEEITAFLTGAYVKSFESEGATLVAR